MSESGTGGDAVVRALKHAGVDTVFGLISIHNLPIYDGIQRQGGIRAVPTRSEPGAVNMADGYARATGRLGVAITSTGTGAGNACGALVEAQTAGSAVLHLTGQVDSGYLDKGRGYIHEPKDQLGMLRGVSKAAYRPIDAAMVPWTVYAAMQQALAAPRGVIGVELPIDYQYAQIELPELPYLASASRFPDAPQVDRAAGLLATARRPVIWAGGGAIAAAAGPELRALAEALGAAVVTTTAGRGVIPEDHPLCVGNWGATPPVRELLATADVLLAVGVRFRGNETLNYQVKLPPTVIQVDVDPLAIGRSYPAAAAIVGDAKTALGMLRDARPELSQPLPDRRGPDPEFGVAIAAARDAARAAMRATMGPYEAVVDALHAVLPRDAIRVRDVTIASTTWGNRLLEVYEPRTSIHAVGGGIGQGFQMALGAKVARPERPVVCIAGDGGLLVNVGEWATAVQENLAVVVVLFNDGGYGVLRHIQARTMAGRHIGVDLRAPDFVGLAEAFGAWARRVRAIGDFRPALEAALECGRPALVELDMAAIGPPAVAYGGPPAGA
ncbi:MAG TPA: thiamine pyrophosphate-binding protein [Chloroflexota bacterium]|jgi:acetolactate synthase-1/2/3 large subunit